MLWIHTFCALRRRQKSCLCNRYLQLSLETCNASYMIERVEHIPQTGYSRTDLARAVGIHISPKENHVFGEIA